MEIKRGAIYASIDWFQAVFYNVDFSFIYHDYLGLPSVPFDDPAVVSAVERRMGYDTQVGFTYNGISVTTRKDWFLDVPEDGEVFHTVFKQVQFMISGDGMRFLRHLNPNIDQDLRSATCVDDLGTPMFHVTRCDFAYDFFNYKPEFLDQCIAYLQELDYNRCSTVALAYATKNSRFSVRTGDQRTVYVGSPRSNKMLRIYDKLMERGGICPEDLPFSKDDVDNVQDINTWFRIEMQCRNDYAVNMLYGYEDPVQRLRVIYDMFAFVDKDRVVKDFWRNLFEWETINVIIQNANTLSVVVTKDKIQRSFLRWIEQGRAFALYYGLPHINKSIIDSITDLHKPSMYRSYAYTNMVNKVALLADCEYDSDGKLLVDRKRLKDLKHVKFVVSGGYEFIAYQ